jgi:tRNA pseudouridine-54 N-methylase
LTLTSIHWNVATKATTQIADSGKTVILTKNGKKIALRALSPSSATFAVGDHVSLPTSPDEPDGVVPNTGTQKISIVLNGMFGDTNITVGIEPYYSGMPASNWSVDNIDDWVANN